MNVIFYCCNEKNIFYSICVKKIKKIARVVFDLWKKWRHRRSATLTYIYFLKQGSTLTFEFTMLVTTLEAALANLEVFTKCFA